MRCAGKVKNGLVILPPGIELPEGQEVEVIAPLSEGSPHLLHEPLASYGAVAALPDDLAANHDYYLHGSRKQQPRLGRWIPRDHSTPELTDDEVADFTERLAGLAAETRNLPSDLASGHDSYLHGLPRR